MPEPVELLDGEVKHEDTIEIRWRFKANLSELPPGGVTLRAPGPVPLAGSWELELTDDGVDSDIFCVRVRHGLLPVGAFGRSVVVKVQLARLVGAHERRLHGWSLSGGSQPSFASTSYRSHVAYNFSASRSEIDADGRWPASEQNSMQEYSYSITLSRNLQLDAARNTLHSRHSNICLRFRRCDSTALELWTTSGLLATASEYYETLLASGCAETVPSGSKRQRSEAPPPIEQKASVQDTPAQPTIDWQDSDDEMNDLLVERDWSGCTTANHNLTDPEYQQIDVRETAYSTMSAVLLYLMTGHIEFAPLKSLLETRSQDVPGTRRTLLDKHMAKHPTLPPSVSPKSVYRLAHLLQREELQRLALDALSTSLTDEGAASELFGPVSIAYADVRQTILKYVVENWARVQATESWKEWRGKVAADEVPGGAAILADLLGALYEGKS